MGARKEFAMLRSYRVACPHAGCDWTGSLVPSVVQGGEGRESTSIKRARFHCPRCQADWAARMYAPPGSRRGEKGLLDETTPHWNHRPGGPRPWAVPVPAL